MAKKRKLKVGDQVKCKFLRTEYIAEVIEVTSPGKYKLPYSAWGQRPTILPNTEETIELTDPKAVAEALGLNDKKKKEEEPKEIEEEIDIEAIETGKKK